MTADQEYVRAIEERRARASSELLGPHSALAAVARHELPIGSALVFGAGPDAGVRLDGIDRTVRIAALPDGFTVDGATCGPGLIPAGRYALRLSHQNYPAVVVLDRLCPRLHEPVELRWYPVDPRYRLRGRFELDGAPVRVASTASPSRPAERAGWVTFSIDGVACRVSLTRLLEPGVADTHLDLYFRDATTGHGSYEVGRYVSVERDGETAIVDFNLAYNPSCALSPFYNCPIPPRENHLAVAIRAGEMAPVGRRSTSHA